MSGLRAIPTEYRGRVFRSRLEATFARFLDALKIRWEYEPRSFLLDDGTHYLPDFWCPDISLWIECRGYDSEKGRRQLLGFEAMLPSLTARTGQAVDYMVIGDFDSGYAKCHYYEPDGGCHWACVVPQTYASGDFCACDERVDTRHKRAFPLQYRPQCGGYLGVLIDGDDYDDGWKSVSLDDLLKLFDSETEGQELPEWRRQQRNYDSDQGRLPW